MLRHAHGGAQLLGHALADACRAPVHPHDGIVKRLPCGGMQVQLSFPELKLAPSPCLVQLAPVLRSHTRVVSRWLVMPSATTLSAPTLASAACSAPVMHASTLPQISRGSCSTHLHEHRPGSAGLGTRWPWEGVATGCREVATKSEIDWLLMLDCFNECVKASSLTLAWG
jgi:hypothetical protein